MKTDIYELSMKAMLGLELTDEERLLVQRRNAKYELVRYLYLEKMKTENLALKDFHFTPNEETFMEVPTIDIVNSIIKMHENLKDAKPLDFGDGTFIFDDGKPIPQRGVHGNPPNTGKVKRTLVD